VQNVDWIFVIGVPAWWWMGEYVTLGRGEFNNLLFKQEEVAAPHLLTDCLLYHIPRESLY